MATCATRMANKSAPQMAKVGLTLTNLGSSPMHKSPMWSASSFETKCIRAKSTATPISERLTPRTSTAFLGKNTKKGKQRRILPLYLSSSSMLALIAGYLETRDSDSGSKCDFAAESSDSIRPRQVLTDQKIRRNAEDDIRLLEAESARSPHYVSPFLMPTSSVPILNQICPKVSVAALQGERWTMEDTYSVQSNGRFVAVFDGHGGSVVSTMLRDHLYEIYRQSLVDLHGLERIDSDAQGTERPSTSTHVEAIREALQTIETKVMMRDDLVYQGSTAVVVIVHEDNDGNRTLLVANVGDSRAVLSSSGKAVALTRDHKPSDDRERARIRAMGEDVEWDPYGQLFRVCDLSLSRAIGDRFAKPAVSSETEITRFPLLGKSDHFVILASDGLWDVMSNQETVDFVNQKLVDLRPQQTAQSHKERRYKIAELLANEALERGSADNVCVLIMWLSDHSSSSASCH